MDNPILIVFICMEKSTRIERVNILVAHKRKDTVYNATSEGSINARIQFVKRHFVNQFSEMTVFQQTQKDNTNKIF